MGTRMLPLACVLFLVGCESNNYEIEITPQGEKFERRLTVSRNNTGQEAGVRSLSDEELRTIASAYKQAVPAPVERKHTFRGQFAGRSPVDVGGYGSCTRYESPCGSVTAYLERFRGGDDLVGEIHEREKGVDTAIDVLIAWCENEMGKDPDFPKLREFLNTGLRRDVKNLSVYAYTLGFGFAESEAAKEEIGARVIQYLLERDYVAPHDVPALMRTITEANERENSKPLWEFLQHVIAHKMGYAAHEAVPASLAFLADQEKAHASLAKFLRGTDAYHKIEGRGAENKTDGEVDPLHVLEEPLARAFLPNGLFTASDQVSLKLAAPRKPFKTNGEWDRDAVELTWHGSVEAADIKGHQIPQLFFASWAEPNATFQEDHFGRVLLDGEDLAQYCLWYKGLTEAEAGEWNKFVGALKPGDTLSKQLFQFRFSTEKPATMVDNIDTKSIAAPAVQLITRALELAKEVEK